MGRIRDPMSIINLRVSTGSYTERERERKREQESESQFLHIPTCFFTQPQLHLMPWGWQAAVGQADTGLDLVQESSRMLKREDVVTPRSIRVVHATPGQSLVKPKYLAQ